MPKVSVIIPVYKVEKYLNQCMDSILQQRFNDIEIILVDDGSPDSCGKMCDEFAFDLKDKDIPIYVIHQVNAGLSNARNSGIDWVMYCSDSDWICFVDSDDSISDLFILKLLNAAESYNADLAICDFMEVDIEGNNLHEPKEFPVGFMEDKNVIFETMYPNWRIHPAWNKLYRKCLFRDLRFDNGKLHEDEFIIHKILFLSDRIVFIPDLLYYYLVRPSGIMGTENRRTRADAYEADINRYWFCKEHHLPLDMWVLGIDYMTLVKEFDDKTITRRYKKIYFDYEPNQTIKKRLSFLFFPIYRRYRKRRLNNG